MSGHTLVRLLSVRCRTKLTTIHRDVICISGTRLGRRVTAPLDLTRAAAGITLPSLSYSSLRSVDSPAAEGGVGTLGGHDVPFDGKCSCGVHLR